MDNHFFKNVENKTGVDMNEILKLVQSLQNANFKDEKTVRSIVKKVSRIANKPVSKELEDQMVQSIVQDGNKLDFNYLAKMMNKS